MISTKNRLSSFRKAWCPVIHISSVLRHLHVLALLSVVAFAAPWPVRVLHRLMDPFRTNPFRQAGTTPCSLGFASCLLPETPTTADLPVEAPDPDKVVTLQLRALHGGPFAHHWLEFDSSMGKVTLGYGPATLPFIDAGQISLQDTHGNVERISGMHPLPFLGLPPLNYRYAKAPGSGHPISKPISMTMAQADALVERATRTKYVGPYIPIFHDCRTYVCAVQAKIQGRSSLPCYLLFKGYW